MINNWRDWLAAILFFAALGWAGTGDYEYRKHQEKKELARMNIASKP
jgi:hypothetical protein